MATQYSYIKADGSTGYTNDQKNAPGIDPHSGFQLVQGAVSPANTMPATKLGANPTTYSSYTPTGTASTGLAESAIAAKDSYIASKAAEAAQLQQTQAQGKTQIQGLLGKLGISATKRANEYESAGLNDDRRAIDSLTSEMESTARSFDKQIETIQNTNPEGKLKSGVDIDINNLTRQKAATLADQAIVLNAKTRNYDTAKSIIDTKADAETEDLKTQLQGLQFFYQENAGDLDKDQQILLQDKISKAQDEYDEAKLLRTQIGNVQLEAAKNGAPLSVVKAIGATQDIEGAALAAGGYLRAPKAAGGASFDAYSDTEQRLVSRANLGKASDQTKAVFLSTPPAFQDAFIRNGSGTAAATPQNIANSLAEWERYQASIKSESSDVDALISQLRGG